MDNFLKARPKPQVKRTQRLIHYPNGNGLIDIYEDGTRVITCEAEEFLPDYPLNIDLKVSSTCSFGHNPTNGTVFCSFCHEGAVTKGQDADLEVLRQKLDDLPPGIELAIGCNQFTDELMWFIRWASYEKRFIVNLIVNQGHLRRDLNYLEYLISHRVIKGLGVSYRHSLKWDIPTQLLSYPHTVFHVIVGLDSIIKVKQLAKKGVKKLVVLGEKAVGFHKTKFNPCSEGQKQWQWQVHSLFKEFQVISFDNLALEQLHLKRFFTKNVWTSFFQHEHSMYIDAVKQTYAMSSRHEQSVSWDELSLEEFFKQTRQ